MAEQRASATLYGVPTWLGVDLTHRVKRRLTPKIMKSNAGGINHLLGIDSSQLELVHFDAVVWISSQMVEHDSIARW